MKKINWGKIWQVVSAIVVILLGGDKVAELAAPEQMQSYQLEQPAENQVIYVDTLALPLPDEPGATNPDKGADMERKYKFVVGYYVTALIPVSNPVSTPGGYVVRVEQFRADPVEAETPQLNGTNAKRLLKPKPGEEIQRIAWIMKI